MTDQPSRQAFVFNDVADLYERARPGYPDDLFDAIVSSVDPAAGEALRVLEIGAGSGKATKPMAQRGCEIVALEPGAELAEIARANLAAFPLVQLAETTFEESAPAENWFDLVLAAQSFHWTDPATRFERAAEALKPTGALAICGNGPVWPDDEPMRAALLRIYDDLAPEIRHTWPAGRKQGTDGRTWIAEIERSGVFTSCETTGWPWQLEQSAREFTEALATQSDHQLFAADRRAALFGAIEEEIERGGGSITVPYESRLWLARR